MNILLQSREILGRDHIVFQLGNLMHLEQRKNCQRNRQPSNHRGPRLPSPHCVAVALGLLGVVRHGVAYGFTVSLPTAFGRVLRSSASSLAASFLVASACPSWSRQRHRIAHPTVALPRGVVITSSMQRRSLNIAKLHPEPHSRQAEANRRQNVKAGVFMALIPAGRSPLSRFLIGG